VVPGETTVYTLTIHNHGPDLATGIVLTGLFPQGAAPLWTQPAQPLCGRQGQEVDCDLGDLRLGDAVTVALDLSIGGTEAPLTGTQPAGVALEMSVLTCAIDRGSGQAEAVCQLARLSPGAQADLRVGLSAAPISGSLVHTATVAANEADPNLANNGATVAIAAGSVTADKGDPMAHTAMPTSNDLVLQAAGPSSVVAGQPFTYTYTIANRGALEATGVIFEDVVPSDMDLVAYAPGLPLCEQQGDALTCALHNLDSNETFTFTLVITGHAGLPVMMELDPLLPGWPICFVLKERTYLHIVRCELGVLRGGQETHVELVLRAIGVQERTTVNTATVRANEDELNPLDNTSTMTITIQAGAD
jgi:uncharacterized repeat protein (TIGR01451 family)